MRLQTIKLYAIAACAMLLAACSRGEQSSTDTHQVVNVIVAESSEGPNTVSYPGIVRPGSERQIAFKVSGTIESIAVKAGQRVAKGQLLAVMDSRDYAEQLRATEAEYAQVKAQAERVMALYEEDATTADNYDRARYGLEQITAKLQHHRDQLADTRIYAPESGIVQDVLFRSGETVGAGMGIISMVSAGGADAEISLPAKVASRVSEIGSATCTLASSGKSFPVKLDAVKPKASASQLYTATFRIPADAEPLIGSSCTVTLTISPDADETTAASQLCRIPSTCIIRLDGREGVYECADSVLRFVPVTVERIDREGYSYVNGIIPGSVIVASGTSRLSAGEAVKPVNAKQEAESKGGLL